MYKLIFSHNDLKDLGLLDLNLADKIAFIKKRITLYFSNTYRKI